MFAIILGSSPQLALAEEEFEPGQFEEAIGQMGQGGVGARFEFVKVFEFLFDGHHRFQAAFMVDDGLGNGPMGRMDPELARQLKELRAAIDTQSDLIMALMDQGVGGNARLLTVLSVLREILAKHGIEPQRAAQICEQFVADGLARAQAELKQILAAREHSGGTTGPSTDPSQN